MDAASVFAALWLEERWLERAAVMEETMFWEHHTITLQKAPGFGFGIAISGGRDNPHFQSGETSIVISDVLKGGPAEGLLQENDRVVMVNGKLMDDVDHAFAVQQLRSSGKTAKITIRRRRRIPVPAARHPGRALQLSTADGIKAGLDGMDEDDEEEEEEEEEEEIYHQRSGRSSRNEPHGRHGDRGGTQSRETARGDRVSNSEQRVRDRSAGHGGREHSPRHRDRDRSHGRTMHDGRRNQADHDGSPHRANPEFGMRNQGRGVGVCEGGARRERARSQGCEERDAPGRRSDASEQAHRDRSIGRPERDCSLGSLNNRREHIRGRSMSHGSLSSYQEAKVVRVSLMKSKTAEEYGLRLGSQIFVKDVSGEGLAARDGHIHEGDIVLKINGTVTENMSLSDARKLIERSKGKLRMVLQRDEQGVLIGLPDLEDSLPSSNMSDPDISEIQSLASEQSDEAQSRQSSHSHSQDETRSPDSETPTRSTGHLSSNTSSKTGSDPARKLPVTGALPTSFKKLSEGQGNVPTSNHGPQSGLPIRSPDGTGGLTDAGIALATPSETRLMFIRSGLTDLDPTTATPSLLHRGLEMKVVRFRKSDSVGLRLAGGNDVGIFVAGVQAGSPASQQGLEEGDQILKVNNVDFQNIVREEAVLFLLEITRGEEVCILAQRKKDVYRRVVESDVGDSFYVRTHFLYEKETPYGLSFVRGEIFRVVDTLYNGKLGSWLAIRIGRNHQEVERGIIPNRSRAEQLCSLQAYTKTAGSDRADFWRFRGLRSVKRNMRKSRDDLVTQPVQTKFPAYERVVLREAGFLRPVVMFGPIADITREKLARELPELCEIAKSEPKDAGSDRKLHGMIRLFTIKQIIDRDKHALLDITPNAVDRLNYAQWYPIVIFLNPDSKAGVKTMRQRLSPESRKSSRKLYERSIRLKKTNSHLFTAIIQLNYMNESWFTTLKETIRQQQNQLVWVSEGKVDGLGADDLDTQDDRISYLSALGSEYSLFSSDSRPASDYEDTDTETGVCTDAEPEEGMMVNTRGTLRRSSEQPGTSNGPATLPPPHRNTLQMESQPMPLTAAGPYQQGVMCLTRSPQALCSTIGMNRASSAELLCEHSIQLQLQPQLVQMGPCQGRPQLPRAISSDGLGSQALPLGSLIHQTQDLQHYLLPVQQRLDQPPEPGQLPLESLQPHARVYGHPAQQSRMSQQRYDPEASLMTHPRSPHGPSRLPMCSDTQQLLGCKMADTEVQNQSYDPSPLNSCQHGRPQGFERQLVPDYNSNHHGMNYSHPSNLQRSVGNYAQPVYNATPSPGVDLPCLGQYGSPCSETYETRSARTPEVQFRYAYNGQPKTPSPTKPGTSRHKFLTSRSFEQPSAIKATSWGLRRPPDSPPGDEDAEVYDEQDKSTSVLSKIKLFESLDSRVRRGRVPTLQEAQQAQVEVGQKHNDIYALPVKAKEPQNRDFQPQSPREQETPRPQAEMPQKITRMVSDEAESDTQRSRTVENKGAHSTTPPAQATIMYLEPQNPAPIASTGCRTPVPSVSPYSITAERTRNKSLDLPIADGTSRATQATSPDHSPSTPNQSASSQMQKTTLAPGTHTQAVLLQFGQPTYHFTGPPDQFTAPCGDASPSHIGLVQQSPGENLSHPTVASCNNNSSRTCNNTSTCNNGTGPLFPSAMQVLPKPATSPGKMPPTGILPRNAILSSGARFPVYAATARPFQRKTESGKFGHGLPGGAVAHGGEITPFSCVEQDSGTDTFPRQLGHSEGLVATPKAIPVSPSALSENDGHAVVATARGVFDSNGGVLSSVETGVSIIVPRGAIPEGLEQEIYFKVCRDNSILPTLDKDKGETLLSPLVMCGPHGLKFLKPVELRLPHCAAMSPDGWSFALKSSESALGDPRRWPSMVLPGDPNYNISTNSVSVLIDHF
uniref:Tight junction protein 1a n=2 Tax=Eptatretus burgeri TaxID=7764 RepID=A0A8C4NF25_EPTBU